MAIAIMTALLTNRCRTISSLIWQVTLFLSVPQPQKLLANIFLKHRYIYLVTCRQCTWTPYYKIEKEKMSRKKLRPLSKKTVFASE